MYTWVRTANKWTALHGDQSSYHTLSLEAQLKLYLCSRIQFTQDAAPMLR